MAHHNNTSSNYYLISEKDLAAFADEFYTDEPDGYRVELGQKDGQIVVRNISDGFRFSTIFEMHINGPYFPEFVNAALSLNQEAAQKRLLAQENRILKEQLALARQQQFGTSSEQKPAAVAEEPIVATEPPPAKEKKPKLRLVSNAGRKPLPEHLPREQVVHALSDAECECEHCGNKLRYLGEDITEQITVIPAQYRVKQHVRKKYSCRKCGNIVPAPMPKSMVPGSSYASPEFLAHLACNKYQLGLPFYRQEAMFKQAGLPFNRTTMANLMITCADQLTPLMLLFQDALQQQKIVHADETTIQVLKEEGRKPQSKSYMWLYRSAASAENQVVIFDYQMTRAGQHPRDFLDSFNGYLHADGYAGYNSVFNAIRVACMAHLRRKFVDAEKILPAGRNELSFAQQAINMIGELYGIERKISDQPQNVRFDVRARESIPILHKFKKWLDDMRPQVVPKGALGKAIHYAIEQWPAMLRYIDDGELAIDNNIAEREIKQVVIGRKNWLFADTPDGALANATMYSLVQTAKANGLDPYAYLRHVFATLPNLKTSDEVKQLLPWNVQFPKMATSNNQLAA